MAEDSVFIVVSATEQSKSHFRYPMISFSSLSDFQSDLSESSYPQELVSAWDLFHDWLFFTRFYSLVVSRSKRAA